MFSQASLEFAAVLSESILKDKTLKNYPELVTLGFWLRRTNIQNIKTAFEKRYGDKTLLPRGEVFHIAPSNVDTIFVYSTILSIFAGNTNTVRVSSKRNEQIEILLEKVKNALEITDMQEYLKIVRYGYDDEQTAKYSKNCNMRVIWGGDATITHIRSIPIAPTATELTFADKFSFAALSSKAVLEGDLQKVCEAFYKDAFSFLQNACSSVRAVVWIGDEVANKEAQTKFWKALNDYIARKQPDIQPIEVIDKLVTQTLLVAKEPMEIYNALPYVNVITLPNLEAIDTSLHCGGGLFYQLNLTSLQPLFEKSTKKYQTLSCFGIAKEEVAQAVAKTAPKGFDRIVPLGSAMEFSPIWDGFELLLSFSREIDLRCI